MSDLTVIYYTSNREKELFESRIRQSLLDAIGTHGLNKKELEITLWNCQYLLKNDYQYTW